MKNRLSAAPGYRSASFTIVCLAMALTAFLTAPACAQPGGAGQFGNPEAEVEAQAPSWWSWQETSARGWRALGAAAEPLLAYRPPTSRPLLKRGSRGDLVVWAQEHLLGAGARLPVSGFFGPRTYAAVRALQLSRGLLPNGSIEESTWSALLEVEPLRPRWSTRRARKRGGAVVSRALPASRPASASLPAKAYEIEPGPAP